MHTCRNTLISGPVQTQTCVTRSQHTCIPSTSKPHKAAHLSPRLSVPDLHEAVTRPTDDARPVRCERNGAHVVHVAAEGDLLKTTFASNQRPPSRTPNQKIAPQSVHRVNLAWLQTLAPVSATQIVTSHPVALTMRFPSGEYATETTQGPCPVGHIVSTCTPPRPIQNASKKITPPNRISQHFEVPPPTQTLHGRAPRLRSRRRRS